MAAITGSNAGGACVACAAGREAGEAVRAGTDTGGGAAEAAVSECGAMVVPERAGVVSERGDWFHPPAAGGADLDSLA